MVPVPDYAFKHTSYKPSHETRILIHILRVGGDTASYLTNAGMSLLITSILIVVSVSSDRCLAYPLHQVIYTDASPRYSVYSSTS